MTLRDLRELSDDCYICVLGEEVPQYKDKDGNYSCYEKYREADDEITDEMWDKEVKVFSPSVNYEGYMELWAELKN